MTSTVDEDSDRALLEGTPLPEGTPLLEARGVIVGAPQAADARERPALRQVRRVEAQVHFEGRSLCCLDGASALLPALAHPELLESGQLLVRGEPAAELLKNRKAGYCPAHLPGPSNLKLRGALVLGARLVGLGGEDVDDALERCHLASLGGVRLGELTPLQHQLAGLAHGLLGDPPLLLIEDAFCDLDDADCDLIETLLDIELHDRAWIAGLNGDSAHGRALMARAEACLLAPNDIVVPPLPPSQVRAEALWVTTVGPARVLCEELRGEGAEVTVSARPDVFLVRGVSGLKVARAALRTETRVIQVVPGGRNRVESRAEPSDHAMAQT